MKKFNFILMGWYFLLPIINYAQNVTIDYATFTSPANCANVFANVQTINGIVHKSEVGGIAFDNANKYVKLEHNYNGGYSVQKGETYSLSYNVKKNYTYKIVITAKNSVTTQEAAGIKIGLYNTSLSNYCNTTNPELVTNDPSFTGSLSNSALAVASTTFTDYMFTSQMMSANWVKFDIGTFTNKTESTSPATQTIYIKKIQIIEIPPPPTFNLAPTSLSILCGSTTAQTFTVNNVYNSPGTLSYLWEVGPS